MLFLNITALRGRDTGGITCTSCTSIIVRHKHHAVHLNHVSVPQESRYGSIHRSRKKGLYSTFAVCHKLNIKFPVAKTAFGDPDQQLTINSMSAFCNNVASQRQRCRLAQTFSIHTQICGWRTSTSSVVWTCCGWDSCTGAPPRLCTRIILYRVQCSSSLDSAVKEYHGKQFQF